MLNWYKTLKIYNLTTKRYTNDTTDHIICHIHYSSRFNLIVSSRFHMRSLIQNFRAVSRIFKKGHFLWSFTQKCLKTMLLLAKRALFWQILQRAASNHLTLISSWLFPDIDRQKVKLAKKQGMFSYDWVHGTNSWKCTSESKAFNWTFVP